MIFRKIDDHLMLGKYTFELEEKKLIKSEIDVDENFNRIFSYVGNEYQIISCAKYQEITICYFPRLTAISFGKRT
jgi:hypothetical protein